MSATMAEPKVAVPRTRRSLSRGPVGPYLASLLITSAATVWVLRLWRAQWSVPFYWSSDAISSAGHFKTTLTTGWYENQPDLGFPYGQHYHDFPFTDDLQPAIIRIFGLFTSRWEIVFNLYYVLGFPLAAVAGLWFLRRCRVPDVLAVALSVLFALAPYHFYRNEIHLFLGEYWMVPFALGAALSVVSGRPLWGNRPVTGGPPWARRAVGVFTGRGAGTAATMVLTPLSAAYYGAFTALIMSGAALAAMVRRRNRRRFGGAVMAGALLIATFVAASVPDLLYARANGADPGGFVRHDADIEFYSLKPLQLLLPADTHPIPWLNRLRSNYDSAFPELGENPALGTAAALGFLLLAGVLVAALLGRWGRSPDPAARRRAAVLFHLASLTAITFLLAMTGGVGAVIGLLTSSIRDWNRLSIFLALLSLAGLGVALSGAVQRRRPRPAIGPAGARVRSARLRIVAAVVLVLGVADQSLGMAEPDYGAAAADFGSEQQFVDRLQAQLPAGSAIFELPYVPWPESPPLVDAVDNDQLRLFLHSSTLKWSGGGLKGRPQTDWIEPVSAEPGAEMIKDLAVVGFVGVVVDRFGYFDSGRTQEASLQSALPGAVMQVSSNGRWSYFSLANAVTEVHLAMTPDEQHAAASAITDIPE